MSCVKLSLLRVDWLIRPLITMFAAAVLKRRSSSGRGGPPCSSHTRHIFISLNDWEFASLTGFPVVSPDRSLVCVAALARARAGPVKVAQAEVTRRLGRCRPPCFCVPAGWTWQLLSCVGFSYEWGSSQTACDVHPPDNSAVPVEERARTHAHPNNSCTTTEIIKH